MSPTGTGLPAPLVAALDRAAAAGALLVVSDFDGTLAPFVDEPSAARAVPEGAAALERLAASPRTSAALLSGRALASLREVSGEPSGVELVGSHGAETSGAAAPLTEDERALHARVVNDLRALAATAPGAHVELKPTAAVLHVRPVADVEAGRALLAAARSGPGALDGTHVTDGKGVVEIAVRAAGKGVAIRALAEATGADAVVFLGDDVTDEHAMAVLGPDDVGIRVGTGESAAAYRVDDIPGAVAALTHLAAARTATTAE